jgi:hypothetical protein
MFRIYKMSSVLTTERGAPWMRSDRQQGARVRLSFFSRDLLEDIDLEIAVSDVT